MNYLTNLHINIIHPVPPGGINFKSTKFVKDQHLINLSTSNKYSTKNVKKPVSQNCHQFLKNDYPPENLFRMAIMEYNSFISDFRINCTYSNR